MIDYLVLLLLSQESWAKCHTDVCNNVATAKEMASIHFWPQAAVTAASTSSRKRLMLADTELSASIFEKVFFSINIIVLRPELGCIHTFQSSRKWFFFTGISPNEIQISPLNLERKIVKHRYHCSLHRYYNKRSCPKFLSVTSFFFFLYSPTTIYHTNLWP